MSAEVNSGSTDLEHRFSNCLYIAERGFATAFTFQLVATLSKCDRYDPSYVVVGHFGDFSTEFSFLMFRAMIVVWVEGSLMFLAKPRIKGEA